MTSSTTKLDLFNTLGQLSKKNINTYSDLSDDDKKAFQPLVIMKWLSGTSNPAQVFFLNELVNPYVFSLHKHKGLLARLMTVTTTGNTQRYKWTKSKSKAGSSTPKTIDLICEYFTYGSKHAVEVLAILSDDEILSFAEQLGRQPDDTKIIKKELKARGKR